MLTPEQEAMLAEIEAREQAATKGPWEWCKPYDTADYYQLIGDGNAQVMDDGSACGEYTEEITPDSPNGQFIAHARADIPALIALVRTLAKRRAVICSRCGGTAQVVDEHGRPCGQTVHTFPCPDCTTGATWEDGE